MKRVFTIIVCVIVAVSIVSAQKYSSISHRIEVIKDKKEKTYFDHGANWFAKLGGGYLTNDVGHETSFLKYNAQFGYQRQIERHGIYIGGLIGIQNFSGYFADKNRDYDTTNAALYMEPMVGVKLKMKDSVVFDFYIAAGYGIGLYHTNNSVRGESSRVVFEASPGVWIKRFYVGLAYQGSVGDLFDNAALINIGFKF